MTMRSVGFQLKTDGKAEVKNDFAEVKKAGEDAMNGIATAAEQSADRAAKATDEYTDRQVAAFQKQAAAAKVAAANASANASFDTAAAQPGNAGQFATVNLDRTTGAARESASAFQDAFDAEEAAAKATNDHAAAATKLRAALDPVYAAQVRYDTELKTYKALLDSGNITEEEHRKAVGMAGETFLDAAEKTQKLGTSTGFTYMQMQMLKSAAFNSYQSLAAGMPILRVLAEQGAEVAQAFVGEGGVSGAMRQAGEASHDAGDAIAGGQGANPALDELRAKAEEAAKKLADESGVKGALQKVMTVLTPTRLLIGGTAAAVLLATKAWYDYSDAVSKMTALSMGAGAQLGETGTQLEANAEAAASAGKISVSAARDLEKGYLGVAASGDALVKLTAITGDFAAATGQDAKGAQQELVAALGKGSAGVEELNQKYGILTLAQVEHIQKMMQEGDQAGAQKVLFDALGTAFDGAADHANLLSRAVDAIGVAASNSYAWLGKMLDRVVTGGAIADQIKSLENQRDFTPSFATGDRAAIQSQIDKLRGQLAQETAAAGRKAELSAAAQGKSIVDSYTGANVLNGYRDAASKLKAALATSKLDPSQRSAAADTLDAYTHAITTFIPQQQKANELAAIDAKIAATKSPSAKAALAAQREEIAAKGQVITSANVESLARSKADAAAAHATKTSDGHAKTLAREAESMEVSAAAAIDVANAYLKSSAAGQEAEARRKAATDATKKGIDVEEQARRQLALSAAEAVSNGAKAVAQMNDETAAREAVMAKVTAGTVSVNDMSAALQAEATLRPLIALRARLQGEALATLNLEIDAQTAALKRRNAADADYDATQAIGKLKASTALSRGSINYASLQADARALAEARARAEQEADEKHYADNATGNHRTDFINAAVADAQAKAAAERATYLADTNRSQAQSLTLGAAELRLVTANDDVRTASLDKLRAMLDLQSRGVDLQSAEAKQLLAGVAAMDEQQVRLRALQDAWAEVKGTGEQFLNDLLNPDGSGIKSLLKDIESEFIKLAALNPLKNLLFGEKLPTLSSVFSLFGGGGSAISNPTVDLSWVTAHNATGTQDWSGGLTYVNENGGEIMDLPGGTRIYPAAESRRMMAANDTGGGGHTIIINADNAVLADTVRGWVSEGIAVASAQGAAGGAQMAAADAARAGRRNLSRR